MKIIEAGAKTELNFSKSILRKLKMDIYKCPILRKAK